MSDRVCLRVDARGGPTAPWTLMMPLSQSQARFLTSLMAILFMAGPVSGPDGALIARDPEMFSERFRLEFDDMNETYAEFGFELEVIEGERPSLAAITEKYGDPDREDDVELILGFGARERRTTLRFHYYRDIGFGVLPADSEPLVMVVKRRPD